MAIVLEKQSYPAMGAPMPPVHAVSRLVSRALNMVAEVAAGRMISNVHTTEDTNNK